MGLRSIAFKFFFFCNTKVKVQLSDMCKMWFELQRRLHKVDEEDQHAGIRKYNADKNNLIEREI